MKKILFTSALFDRKIKDTNVAIYIFDQKKQMNAEFLKNMGRILVKFCELQCFRLSKFMIENQNVYDIFVYYTLSLTSK